MRRGGAILLLVLALVLIVGFVDYRFDWPFGLFAGPQQSAAAGAPMPGAGSSYVARYSNVRGLQDAPRDDVAQGATLDMQHCLNTMALRELKPAVAKHTCDELIAGISR